MSDVSRILHIAKPNLVRQIKANPETKRALESGHARLMAQFTKSLHEKARSGNVPAIKLALELLEKSRLD